MKTDASVAFVIMSLELGGAERVLSLMANYWARSGRRVSIITLRGDQPPFYELDPRIAYSTLHVGSTSSSLWQALRHNLNRIVTIRRAIRRARPDVVISFMAGTNVVTLLATRLFGIPVLVSERSLPSVTMPHPIWRFLRRVTYPWAERLVVQSRVARDELAPPLRARARIIPNPVVELPVDQQKRAGRAVGRRRLVAIGRLEPVKRLDHLLAAFAAVAPRHPDWSLVLAGAGSLDASLKTQAQRLGISEKVELVGAVRDPRALLAEADLFAMTSAYEGMPNSLLEAMSAGVPVVSYNCPGGIGEIVEHDRNGWLVESGNIDALAQAIGTLFGNPELRQRLGEAALGVRDTHSIARIMHLWEAEVGAVTKGAHRP